MSAEATIQTTEQVVVRPQVPKINIDEAIALLKSGYSRWEEGAYEPGKSIQSYYGLTFSQCKALFNYPKIKGLKVQLPTLIIVDGDQEHIVTNTNIFEATNLTEENTPAATEEVVTASPEPSVSAQELVSEVLTGAIEVDAEPQPTMSTESVFDTDAI